MVNPETELPGREIFADTRSGRQAGRGSGTHDFDDHRTRRIEAFERRFAKAVAAEGLKLGGACHARRIVLASSRRMISYLRLALGKGGRRGPEVHDLDSDISRKTPRQIQAHLARASLVPPCAAPGRRHRPL